MKFSTSIFSAVYRGGTKVTVFGSNLNSVAEPRITVTVVVTRLITDTSITSNENETVSQVIVISSGLNIRWSVIPFVFVLCK